MPSNALAKEPHEESHARSTAVSREKATVRINVNLSEETYNTLKEQAMKAGMDMSEFVRNALRVYNSLQREKLEGKHIYIGTSNKVEKELLVP